MTVRECCLTKLLPHILFEKNISTLKTAPAQWTSTVPVVSAHFRSPFTATTHRALCEIHRQFPWLFVTLLPTSCYILHCFSMCLYTINFTVQNVKKRRPSKQKNVSKWRQEAHNSLPKFWRIPKLDVRNVQFSPVRWLPPAVLSNSLTFPYQLSNFLAFLGFPSQWLPCSMSLVLGITKKYPAKSINLRTAILNSRVKTSQAVKLSLLNSWSWSRV